MNSEFECLACESLAGDGLDEEGALRVLQLLSESAISVEAVQECADAVRQKWMGPACIRCSDGFTSNECSGGCSYCYLSIRNRAYVQNRLPHALNSADAIVQDAKRKWSLGATNYKIVGTEWRLPRNEFSIALEAFETLAKETDLTLCASMGALDAAHLRQLRSAGVTNYNHNVETTRKRYGTLCCTLSYDEKIATNERARNAGLQRCSGFMMGMGESVRERIAIGRLLHDLEVESIPINVFVPIDSRSVPQVTESDGLLTIAIVRLMCPRAHIIANNGNIYLGGDREAILRCGASGIGLSGGNYLDHARS